MSDIIKSLKDLGEKHEVELRKIREKIRILESVPKAKALNGKCFKYKSGFIFGNRRGWIYKHVAGVAGENLIIDTIQLDGINKYEFTFHEVEYFSRFTNSGFIPISKRQYTRIFNKLISQIILLNKRRIKGI